jgi:serine/threonine-protein kinase
LIEPAGGGTLCRVFRARERSTGAMRAIKLLRPEWEGRPEAREFLMREALVAQRVRHPNLIQVHAARLHESPYFLVLEWLDGQPVDGLLAQHGRLAIPRALWIARQAATALAALEGAGYVHGDVKPGNLFLTTAGRVKLIDLGFVREIGAVRTPETPLVGTANYWAPERTQPGARADIRSDLYSLGITLYEMLTGELPFPTGDVAETIRHQRRRRPYPLRRRRPEVPLEVARMIESLLAKEPLRRPSSVTELVEHIAFLEVVTFRLH